MQSASPSGGHFELTAVPAMAWQRTRAGIPAGALWSSLIVFLLVLTIARSTVAASWVPGLLDSLPMVALAGAVATADDRPCPRNRSARDQRPELPGRPERLHALLHRADVCASAVVELHRVDRQGGAREHEADGRRPLGLLGDGSRGDGGSAAA